MEKKAVEEEELECDFGADSEIVEKKTPEKEVEHPVPSAKPPIIPPPVPTAIAPSVPTATPSQPVPKVAEPEHTNPPPAPSMAATRSR